MAKIAVIGSGFSGLSAAAYSAREGNDVHVFEMHNQPGGRARQFSADGFVFDMGPSWYWMPDIIESFFENFGWEVNDFFHLVELDPQFEIIFPDKNIALPACYDEFKNLFEAIEPGAGKRLDDFMDAGEIKYKVGMNDYVTKPCHSWTEFISLKIALSASKLDLLTNFRSYVRRYFQHPYLRTIMEFPVIFLGASPQQIPALYSLMNYGGYKLGTHYPLGGFYQLVLAMQKVAELQGAQFHFNSAVEKILYQGNKVTGLNINGEDIAFDAIIATGDYCHMEELLPEDKRNYSSEYWSKKVFAPSCLIYYLGFKEKIPGLLHHTLFFEHDLDDHIDSIYTNKQWPDKPLFYACCPSKTDDSVAPPDGENLFLLMPLATGIEDNAALREKYLAEMLQRIEKKTGLNNLSQKIVFKRGYCVKDFEHDYHAYMGNAYGLANTLKQTAFLKPKMRNRHLKNLYYAGQLTVPGPGVPPSIISGKIAATELNKKMIPHEKII